VQEPFLGRDRFDVACLLEQLEPDVRRLLWRFHVPAEDAEDLLQDAVVSFLLRREEISTPEPWFLATLKNRCLQYWRRRRRSLLRAIDAGLLEEIGPTAAPEQERADLRRDLDGALGGLTPRCRKILKLRYGYEYTGPEIASQIGAREDTVRQATLRCLSALSRNLTARSSSPEGTACSR
jgi:RNA polymerase sigma factor (sigma-70 family)